MYIISLLLLFVPGIITWMILRENSGQNSESTLAILAKWLVYDLLILILCYFVCLFYNNGIELIDFSGEYNKKIYYSVYKVAFVIKYGILSVCMATGLALIIRYNRKVDLTSRLLTIRKSLTNLELVMYLVLLAFFISQVWLHHQQFLRPGKLYWSDLPAQLTSMSHGTYYSKAAYILFALYKLFGTWGYSFGLACFQIASIFLFAVLLKKMAPLSTGESLFLAFFCSIENAVSIPGYAIAGGAFGGISCRNTTSIMSVTLAMLAFLQIIEMYPIGENLSRKNWIILTLELAISASISPVFLLCFAPALLLVLIVDFVRSKGRNVKNEILMGITVFPGIILCLPTGARVQNETTGIVWSPFTAYLHAAGSFWMLLRGFLFVLVVLLLFGWKYRKEFALRFATLQMLVGLFIAMGFIQTGGAMWHQNLVRPAYIVFPILFVMATALVAREFRNNGNKMNWKIVICTICFSLHAVSGLYEKYMYLKGLKVVVLKLF